MLALTLVSLNAATYYVGADGGATLSTAVAGKGYRNYTYSYGVGYKAGVPFVVMFNDNLGIKTGVSMYGKYYRYSQTVTGYSGEPQTNFLLSIKNGFLEFPIALKADLPLNGFDLYFTAGGYVGAWLYGNRSGSVHNGNSKAENVSEDTDLNLYNRFDAGVSVSVGGGIEFGQFVGYVEGEYALSLTDMNKSQKFGSFPVHNSTFAVTLGLLWGINK